MTQTKTIADAGSTPADSTIYIPARLNMTNIPREWTQTISLTCLLTGMVLMLATSNPILGVAFIGFSCWVLMMSESLLHNKIQFEMSGALEALRKKQQADIQDLLCFLRHSQLASSPFDSLEGAKALCGKMRYPSMVLTTSHQIIKANNYMHSLLGWDKNKLNGVPAHIINDPVLMSKIGELSQLSENERKTAAITQYVYVSKSGEKIPGQMDCSLIKNEGYFVVFHPSKDLLISHKQIESYLSNQEYIRDHS